MVVEYLEFAFDKKLLSFFECSKRIDISMSNRYNVRIVIA